MIQTDEYRQSQLCPNVTDVLVLSVEEQPSCPYDYTLTVLNIEDSNKPLPDANVDIDFTERLLNGECGKLTRYHGRTTQKNGQVVLPMNTNGNYSIVITKPGYDKKILTDETNCPKPPTYTHEGWAACQGCVAEKTVKVTMPHCNIMVPITVRNERNCH